MRHPIVFINASGDTFTPTKSGSLGPWIWEVCRAAERQSEFPFVISRNQCAESFPWPHKSLVEWPRIPGGKVARFFLRLHRKVRGWAEFGQGVFAARVARAIRDAGLAGVPMFLQNDPEIAVYLRREFPRASIICHFQNQQESRPPVRKRFALAVDHVTACSEFTGRWIERYYGLTTGSVTTIYSGVDCKRFAPVGARVGPPVINFTGRTGIEKAPDLLLAAALELSRRTLHFSVQLLGASVSGWQVWNPFQERITSMVEELRRLGIDVRWPGHIDRFHIAEEMSRAHIHVTPSRWDEPFGLVTLEAMACGLATVGSRTGGTPEIIGDCGVMFERDNVAELADRLHELVVSESLRKSMGEKARTRAETFTWDRTWCSVRSVAQGS